MRSRFLVVVHLLVRAEGRLLLLRRSGTGRADGRWAPPGGHLEAGEWPRTAALRECLEETGVAVPGARIRPLATLAFAEPEAGGAGFNLLFGAELPAMSPPRPDPACAAEAAWCDPAALPRPAVPWLPEALARGAAVEALPTADSPWYGEPEPP